VADFAVKGIDRQNYCFRIDYPRDRVLKGKSEIRGAGMPIRNRGEVVGRGNFVIQYVLRSYLTFLLLRNLQMGDNTASSEGA
jgi:DnaJ family protein B protein 4